MGKTGTTNWIQIKGVKGQIRLVPAQEGTYKKPGPNQRFKSGSRLKRVLQTVERAQRRPARGRGRAEVDRRVRRRIKRPSKYVMGSKAKR